MCGESWGRGRRQHRAPLTAITLSGVLQQVIYCPCLFREVGPPAAIARADETTTAFTKSCILNAPPCILNAFTKSSDECTDFTNEDTDRPAANFTDVSNFTDVLLLLHAPPLWRPPGAWAWAWWW